MRLSTLLVPPLKQLSRPSSVDLLAAHGFIHKHQSGVYDILPLGLRIQRKIEAIARKHMDAAGARELALTSLVDPELWHKSGRLTPDRSGEFMFAGKHLLAPTAEEQVTALVGSTSYRQLPLSLYQITRKYRDELRAKSGLLRTREFTMKDAYTFSADEEGARAQYAAMAEAYTRIFEEIGVPFVRAAADSGSMGGSLSHEYHLLSPLGEDAVMVCEGCGSAHNAEVEGDATSGELSADSSASGAGASCPCGGTFERRAGIEVGHTFYLGTRYTEPLGSKVTLKTGQQAPIEMGSYGIGISRLIGAIADVTHTEKGLHWPQAVAPAQVCVVGLDVDQAADTAAFLESKGFEAVSEDRTTQLGHALRAGREAGWPALVILGKKYQKEGLYEIETRQGSVLVYQNQLQRALRLALEVSA